MQGNSAECANRRKAPLFEAKQLQPSFSNNNIILKTQHRTKHLSFEQEVEMYMTLSIYSVFKRSIVEGTIFYYRYSRISRSARKV